MFLKRSLLIAALLALPARTWAIEINVPCETPSVFANAAVNVVVLPYSLPASFAAKSKAGEQLGALVQLETILAIAKFGSVGVTQLVGDPREGCTPEVVLDKLSGRQRGAGETVRSGGGLILIWGRVFESGQDLYLQTFIRFMRAGVDETVDVAVRDQTLKGALSTQAFACAPRKIALRDLEDIRKQFQSARVLYAKPDLAAPAVKIPETAGALSYWVTDVRGDWVQLEPMDRGNNRKFERGWVQARPTDAQWSLRRHMPELYFVEGAAGYLSARVRSTSQPSVDAAFQGADSAIARYTDAWGVNAVLGSDAAAGGTPLAVAVPRQLRGFIALLRGRGSDAALADARAQFERAATLVPHSSQARNLAAMTRVAQTYVKPAADRSPRRFIDEFRSLLGTDPDNMMILANLGVVYDLVLATTPGAPASWALPPNERGLLEKQRDSLRPLLKRPI